MKEIFKCLAVIIGTIIGAGFASGKEIITFFNMYGNKGLLGIIIASFIFGLVVILGITVINRKNIVDYKQIVNNSKAISSILQFFSVICFCIMVSGVGAFCEEQLNINFWHGAAFAAAISYAMFLNKFKAIESISCLLVPFIVIGIIVLGFSNYEGLEIIGNVRNMQISNGNTGNFFLSSVLYASYNSLIVIPILINFKKYNLSSKKVFIIGAMTSAILCFLMILIYNINNLFYPEIVGVELPNMMLASLLSNKIKIAYGIVMLIAIFTTAFSCGFSFLEMREKRNYEKNALIMCIVAFAVSKIGFSNMINICFPIFGFFGIFQIILILVIGCRGVRNEKK